MRKILAAAVAFLLLTGFDAEPLPLPEVTIWEITDWRQTWATVASHSLDVDLLGEWRWMRDTYFPPPLRIRPVPSRRPVERPTPVSVTRTAYPPGVEQWRAMVASFWPAEHVDRMLRIMACESGGNPYADNPRSSALGLFQIMGFWQKTWPGDYTDPWTNAAVAYQIWLSQGYGAWVCRG